jgi:hypothetical protein
MEPLPATSLPLVVFLWAQANTKLSFEVDSSCTSMTATGSSRTERTIRRTASLKLQSVKLATFFTFKISSWVSRSPIRASLRFIFDLH